MTLSTADSPPPPADTGQQFIRQLPANWLRSDIILAVVVGFVSVLSLQALRLTDIYAATGVDYFMAQALSLLISSLLVLYRRYPVTIASIYTAAIIVLGFIAASTEFYSLLFVGFMTLYAVGAWVSNRRVALWTRVVIIGVQWAGTLLLTFVNPELDPATLEDLQDVSPGEALYVGVTAVLLSVGYYFSAWYFGSRAWHRAKERWKLQKAHDELAAANLKIADAAVQAERMHIARELHDVIAHHVTVMGIHASAARRLIEAQRDTSLVVEQLEHIEQSSAQAVQELQTMVYTLRDQDGSAEPLPDLSQLPQLVEQADSTTQTVTFSQTGQRVQVSSAVELTLYRVAQEALSNARKHAGDDTQVHVELNYGDTAVMLTVTDNGKAYQPVRNGTGTGIQGMKERVHAVDGRLEYGPRTPYGWKVTVRVPYSLATERGS